MGWLDGSVALVTGAGSGLGRGVMGHYVLLASRANSLTVTGSVHNCDGGMGVRGRREQEASIATALTGD